MVANIHLNLLIALRLEVLERLENLLLCFHNNDGEFGAAVNIYDLVVNQLFDLRGVVELFVFVLA
jgi:hypothetical protein